MSFQPPPPHDPRDETQRRAPRPDANRVNYATLVMEQTRLLEMIATGVALQTCLSELTVAASRIDPAVRAGVVLASPDRTSIQDLHTARLPESFGKAVHGAPVSDLKFGTCGTAIHTNRMTICSDIEADTQWAQPWRRPCLGIGLKSCLSMPIGDTSGQAIGSFFLGWRKARAPNEQAKNIATFGAYLAGVAINSDQAKRRMEAARAELQAEMARARLLQDISVRLLSGDNEQGLYDDIVFAATEMMASSSAALQLLSAQNGNGAELRLLACKGFDPCSSPFWDDTSLDSHCLCKEALRSAARVSVPDISQCAFMSNAAEQDALRTLGVTAVQATPLISRAGAVIGMLSTHWQDAHPLSDHDERLLDLLVRQACDLIDHKHTELKLLEADQRKNEFMAQLAHELRNPLAAIRNVTDLLHRRFGADPNLSSLALLLGRQIKHFSRPIDDLLDVGRVGQANFLLRKEHVLLQDVIKSAMEMGEAAVRSKQQALMLSMDEPAILVNADPVRLAQVFANLINNASKFSPVESTIDVSVRAEQAGAAAQVRVRDHGIGLSREDRAHIFDMFFRVDRANAQGGLGIGLYLVKRLVDLHGGQVEVSSRGLGKGAEFTVTLPMARSNVAIDASATPASGRTHRPLKILIADDNRDALETLAAILKLENHDVLTAPDGQTAWALAMEHKPEVIMLDISMPGMDGYAVCRRVRGETWGGGALIFAMSGYGGPQDIERSRVAGFDHHFVKPADLGEVLHCLLQRE